MIRIVEWLPRVVVLTHLAAAAPTVALRHAGAASALPLQQVNIHL
jgi:hypothetical protein